MVVTLGVILALTQYAQTQGPFSAQIQLALRAFMAKANTWTGTQTFTNLTVSGTCTGCGGGASALLNTPTHTDTLTGTVVRGDIIYGNGTPNWARLAKGAAKTFLTTNATDTAWGALTTTDRILLRAATCNNATATTLWDLPTSLAPTPACDAGTNATRGVLDFPDASTTSAYYTIPQPMDGATGSIDVNLLHYSTAGNAARWSMSIACVKFADSPDLAFNLNGGAALLITSNLTANQLTYVTLTNIQPSISAACNAGTSGLLVLKLQRIGADGADTSTATVRFVALELIYRRIVVQ